MTEVVLSWDETLLDYSRWVEFRRPDLPPGAAQWRRGSEGNVHGIAYACPCGCAEWRSISVVRGPANGAGQTAWGWDGDESRPTLTPSILHIPNSADRCNWHGFLTDGVWRSC